MGGAFTTIIYFAVFGLSKLIRQMFFSLFEYSNAYNLKEIIVSCLKHRD